jgi:hypothetical protein
MLLSCLTCEQKSRSIVLTCCVAHAVANNLLTSSPSLSNTVHSLNLAFSEPVCQTQTIRSAMSLGNTSPLAATLSGPNTPGISAALSGLSLGNSSLLIQGNSGLLMTSETVAPCLKGANKHRAKLREVQPLSTFCRTQWSFTCICPRFRSLSMFHTL